MYQNREAMRKGLYLGFFLMILHKIIYFFVKTEQMPVSVFLLVFVLFAVTVFLFLYKNNLKTFFLSGFTGLFSLIAIEIIFGIFGINSLYGSSESWFMVYVPGFIGSMAAAFLCFILIAAEAPVTKQNDKVGEHKKDVALGRSEKISYLAYGFISAASFSYFVLPEQAGVSVPLFIILQMICLWFLAPEKKRLWVMVPVLLISFHSLISANQMWRFSNIAVSVVLYGVMYTNFDRSFFVSLIDQLSSPVHYWNLPFQWGLEAGREKATVMKRILLALGITLPVLLILVAVLSSADMIFQKGIEAVWLGFLNWMNLTVFWKIIFGLLVGCYLLGALYYAHQKEKRTAAPMVTRQGDLLILTVMLGAVLVVYTVFCVIQFKYLFAGSVLPYGLTYTTYARKGFFELLFLTGINIILILLTVFLTREKTGAGRMVTKLFCSYLCVVTLVLLSSSFYRMYLYCMDDGLTRLRFMVFGFLIFEAIGLFITFYYIFQPRFSMVSVYAAIALAYYVVLNLVPMDYFVAKSQVDMYLQGQREEVEYALTLSEDAAPQIIRLLDSDAKEQAENYFERHQREKESIPRRWQRYNLSKSRCYQLYQSYISGEE